MRRIIIAIILSLITACTGFNKKPISTSIPDIPMPKTAPETVNKKLADKPRTLKISLTLRNPDDLKIKSGQEIKAGDILSDRVEERRSLP